MKKWIFTSLLVNVAVLIPVCAGLITGAVWTEEGYGPATPASSGLLSIYLAILVVSLLLLRNPDSKLVTPLLLVQVIYKFSTPLTVGTIQNPVVLSNLGIAVLHTITLWVIWNSFILNAVSTENINSEGILCLLPSLWE